jgi:hypothetical protein
MARTAYTSAISSKRPLLARRAKVRNSTQPRHTSLLP